MSQTYRRYKSVKRPHSRWEMCYGRVAAKILRKGNMRMDNLFSVAKFFGAFVYVYSFPYEWVKKLSVRRKLRKAAKK